MSLFEDDPTENAEDRMSDGLVQGCVLVIVAILFVVGIIATVVKAWS